jgi:FkbM family methyltransferase
MQPAENVSLGRSSHQQVRNAIAWGRKFLRGDPKVIFEMGAREASDTLAFAEKLPESQIFAFECNPGTLSRAREAVADRSNIKLIEKAVADREGRLTFHAINSAKTISPWTDGNPGASSLFKASGKFPVETYVQDEVSVEATTLKKVIEDERLDGIDLLWLDLQGAELMALRGLGSRLRDVKVIHTELEFFEIYAGQPLYADVNAFLGKHGFRLVSFTSVGRYFGDGVYVNKSLLSPTMRVQYALKHLALHALALAITWSHRLPITWPRKGRRLNPAV